MSRAFPRSLPWIAATVLVTAVPGLGQSGFTSEGARAQRAIEQRVLDSIVPEELERTARALAARPHVAGSPGQAAVRDSLVAWLADAGFEPEVATYRVFLPWPTRSGVGLVGPDSIAFSLAEPAIPGDPATAWPQYPWVNGYSGTGTAEAEVVYAGYGLHDDYAALDSLGIDVAGRVVVARYGRSFRGVKARLAERRGAAALVLYSDPADDGYVRGDVYPDGPFRPWTGVQRGSVMNGVGDPTTPHGPSVDGAERVAPGASPHGLPTIPVVPVSYEVAGEILSRLGGPGAPDREWQGALPFRYHLGPGPARLRVTVEDDRDDAGRGMKPVHDVLARVEGRTWPDEWVVVGGHVDAWGAGAMDNVSGTASVVAAARAVADLVRAGERPRRTIVFAGWDGEEWGLIGSTEWVEEHAAALTEGGVAYLNQDVVGGSRFRGGGSPSLEPLVEAAARVVPMADGSSLYDAWREDFGGDDPGMGNLGGGSDFAGFYNHLAIPSASFGFGAPGGVYHSAYDTAEWMDAFADPGYENHARSAELVAILALRLANAEVLPHDFVAWAGEIDSLWRDRVRLHGEAIPPAGTARMSNALAALREAAARLAASRTAYLEGAVDPGRSRRANRILRSVERALSRPEGLVGRPWYRNLAFASDARNGYATLAFPSVVEAVRAGEPGRIRRELADLAERVREAAERLEHAAGVLDGESP